MANVTQDQHDALQTSHNALRALVDTLQTQLADQTNGAAVKRQQLQAQAYTHLPSDSWHAFKDGFQYAMDYNKLSDKEIRAQLHHCMVGPARRAIGDIKIHDAALYPTWQSLLQAYEDRFLPPQQSEMVNLQLEHCRQAQNENILEYQARLRELYYRAFPTGNDTDRMLIRRFIYGLLDPNVAHFVLRRKPTTYQQAIEAATGEASIGNLISYSRNSAGKSTPLPHSAPQMSESQLFNVDRNGQFTTQFGHNMMTKRPMPLLASIDENDGNDLSINAIDPKTATCLFCDRIGHFRRDCPLWLKAKATLAKPESRQQPRKRFNSQRGGMARGRTSSGRPNVMNGMMPKPRYPNKRTQLRQHLVGSLMSNDEGIPVDEKVVSHTEHMLAALTDEEVAAFLEAEESIGDDNGTLQSDF